MALVINRKSKGSSWDLHGLPLHLAYDGGNFYKPLEPPDVLDGTHISDERPISPSS